MIGKLLFNFVPVGLSLSWEECALPTGANKAGYKNCKAHNKTLDSDKGFDSVRGYNNCKHICPTADHPNM